MRKELLIIALGLWGAATSATADVLATPEASAPPAIELPKKGASMAEVQKKFGNPALRQKTVGGDSPKHPPITRWDYADFYVIFERDKTIDAVIPGKHPTVYNKEELKPAAETAVKPAAEAAAKPAAATTAQPAVPAEAPVMKTTEIPIAPAEGPATAKKMEAPQAEATAPAAIVPAPEPAAAPAPAPAPAPAAAPAPAPKPAPAPAPARSPGDPAVASPVPDTPPTPK